MRTVFSQISNTFGSGFEPSLNFGICHQDCLRVLWSEADLAHTRTTMSDRPRRAAAARTYTEAFNDEETNPSPSKVTRDVDERPIKKARTPKQAPSPKKPAKPPATDPSTWRDSNIRATQEVAPSYIFSFTRARWPHQLY